MIDLAAIDLVTFDCFGTLLDWRAPLAQLGLDPASSFQSFESACRRAQHPTGRFVPYVEVLATAAAQVAPHSSPDARAAFSTRFGTAPPFDDAVGALALIQPLVALGAVSNSDPIHQLDVSRSLRVPWDIVALSAHVGAYKPHARAWDALVAHVERERPEQERARWLHVSAFREYDLGAARARGIRTCFVSRPGVGDDTLDPDADLRVASLSELARAVGDAADGPIVYALEATLRDPETAERWVAWMRTEHLGRVCSTPVVRGAAIEQRDPVRYRVAYQFARRADYQRYEREYAPALRGEGLATFGPDQATYARTVSRTLERR